MRFAPTAPVTRRGTVLLAARCRSRVFGCTGTVTVRRGALHARTRLALDPEEQVRLTFALGRAAYPLARRGRTVRLVANVAAAGRIDDIALPIRLAARKRRSRR
jgi:hypothetical protein